MFADTTFTMKSGQYGTSMFSRSGKCTNYQYLCFNPMQEEQAADDKKGDETTNKLLQESEKQAMMNTKQQAASPQKTMQETANQPGSTMHHAFGHTKMGETKMAQTKRSSVDAVDQSKKKVGDEDDESTEKTHKKGPPVP